MAYQSQIPDDFVAPQFRDDRFYEAFAAYTNAGNKPGAPWVIAIARPELDPTSRTVYDMGGGNAGSVAYKIGAKDDQVAMMHVIARGKGRVRLGYREAMPVEPGDMVLVNLREAGHWFYLEGLEFYCFTGDVAMARIYRTTKTVTRPEMHENEHVESYRDRLETWRNEPYWNLRDVLNDYVVLGYDPNAEREMRRGKGSPIVIAPDQVNIDGVRSDDARDNRFPMVYRRVLGCGPGRSYRKEDDLGFPDYVHSRAECEPGDMMCYTKSVRAAVFRFQSMPLEIIHASSIIDSRLDERLAAAVGTARCELHASCATPIPWDAPSEVDPDEDAALRGQTG